MDRERTLSPIEEMPYGFTSHKKITDREETDYLFLHVNSAFLSLTGLQRDHVLGETLGDLTDKLKNLSFPWREAYQRLEQEGGPLIFDHLSDSLGLLKITMYSYEYNEVATLFERMPTAKEKRMERLEEIEEIEEIEGVEDLFQGLKEIKEHLFTIFNSMDDSLITTDVRGQITRMNQKAEELTGWRIEEALGRSIHQVLQIYQLPTREEVRNPLWEVIKTREPVNIAHDTILLAKDGREHLITLSAAPIYSPSHIMKRVVLVISDVTENYEAREALRESEMRYSTLVSNVPGIVYSCRNDRDWTMDFISQGIEELSGYPSWHFLKGVRSFNSLIHPHDQETVYNRVQEALAERRPFTNTFRIKRKDGDIRWVQGRGQGLINDEGELESIDGVMVDIHERKMMEEALFESEKKYRLLFHNAPLGVLHFDGEGRITACNDKFVEIIGSSREILVGLPMLELPDEEVVSAVKGALSGETRVYEGEYHSVTAKKVTPLRAIFTPLDKEGGEVEGGMGIVEDATKRERAKEELRRSQRRYRELVEKIEEGICTFNAREEFLFANPAAERIFGLYGESLVGRNLREFVHEKEYQAIEKKRRQHLQGYTDSYSFTIQRPDKEKRILQGTFSPSDSEDKTPILGVIWDITELRQAQEALKKSEEMFRTYTREAPIGIFVVNGSGDFIEVNPQGCRMSGFTREELFKKKAPHLLAKEYKKKGLYLFSQVMRRGSSASDVKMQRKEGEPFWVHFAAVKIHEDAYMALCQDINQVKEAQENLDQIIEEQRLLLNNIEVQVWYLVDERRYGAVNRAHASFFGFKEKDLEQRPLEEVLPPLSAKPLIQGNAQVFQERTTISTEETIGNGEGVDRILSITRTPKVNAEGLVEYVICSAVDITEQKEVERQIRHMSFHDSLTNLYNRAYLEEEMRRLDTKRQLPISIIMGDINGLKLVNDTYGYSVGDELLTACAEILKRSCREEDIISRWGGDEFVVLLPQTSREDVAKINHRIKEESSRVKIREIPIQLALGTATKEDQKESIYEILQEAENRMYKQKLMESRSSRGAITSALLRTLGEKSNETEEHAWRMQKMALKVGAQMNLSPSELDRLSLLLTLHDIGKISIPEKILRKPGQLTEKEWEVVKTHPETGYRIASSIEEFSHVARDILSHHERWDGYGYPQGLKGKEIPLLARIASIVDAFDVMTSYRPYKETMSLEEAMMELKSCSGTQFDPKVVNLFLEVIENGTDL